MKAGALKEYITIKRATTTPGGTGKPTAPSWDDYAFAWAQITPILVSDTTTEKQVIASPQFSVMTRYIDLLPTDRILWNNKYYAIISSVAADRESIKFAMREV